MRVCSSWTQTRRCEGGGSGRRLSDGKFLFISSEIRTTTDINVHGIVFYIECLLTAGRQWRGCWSRQPPAGEKRVSRAVVEVRSPWRTPPVDSVLFCGQHWLNRLSLSRFSASVVMKTLPLWPHCQVCVFLINTFVFDSCCYINDTHLA